MSSKCTSSHLIHSSSPLPPLLPTSCITVGTAAKTQLAPQMHLVFVYLVEPCQDMWPGEVPSEARADRGIIGHLHNYLRDEIKHLFDQLKINIFVLLTQVQIPTHWPCNEKRAYRLFEPLHACCPWFCESDCENSLSYWHSTLSAVMVQQCQ